MNAYNYDAETKKYIGLEPVFSDPRVPDRWLIPANSTLMAPPVFNEDQEAYWTGSSWEVRDILATSTTQTVTDEQELTWELAKQKFGSTWDTFRTFRNMELSQTDWVALPDVNTPNKQAWLEYRQEIRDLPQRYSTPEMIIWPTKP